MTDRALGVPIHSAAITEASTVANTDRAPYSGATWGTHAPSWPARLILALSRSTLLGRGIARKFLFRSFNRHHAGPVDVALWGGNVRLHPANNVSERKALMRPDQMDAREHTAVREAMAHPGAVFVDIGGNAGLYSLGAALHAGPGATILMIEPDEALIERFAFNLAEAERAKRIASGVTISTQPIAISATEGEAMLSADGEEGSRHLVEGASPGARRVRTRPLLDVANDAHLSRIDAMKIDVEGHEDKVLPPFLATAAQSLWPRLIVIEHLQRAAWNPDCIADAIGRGYEIAFVTRNNTVLRRP